MNHSAVAVRYTEALIDAAEERNALDRVASDVEGLLLLLQSSSDLQSFVSDPMIQSEQKKKVFRNVFNGKIDALTLNFLLLLCDKHRERILAEILSAFQTTLDMRRGIVTAKVTSAVALTSEQQNRLLTRLSAWSGRQVRLETTVDEGLKAGFIARMGDQVFDGTLATQLRRLQRRLVAEV